MNGGYQLAALAALGFVAYALLDTEQGRPNMVEKAVNKTERQVQEFACLSQRDGTLKALRNVAKDRVRYPEAFEHLKTTYAPTGQPGMFDVKMNYRVRDAAGNLHIKFATATVRSSDCVTTKTEIPK